MSASGHRILPRARVSSDLVCFSGCSWALLAKRKADVHHDDLRGNGVILQQQIPSNCCKSAPDIGTRRTPGQMHFTQTVMGVVDQ